MSSPDYLGLGDDPPPPATTRARSERRSDSALPLHTQAMNVRNSSIARESIVIKDDEVEELVPKGRRSNKVQIIQESSEDDEPIAATRQCHDTRPSIHADTKPLPKKFAIKAVKKTVQSTYVSKPIMKNDIKAKKGVVKEIESYWGKGFIKSHIPKCHRPLAKRGMHGKRSVYRKHEIDPMKWLPSVLKAILMIAKLTNNKKWLSDAMTEVVRYRIKNTGNRKPQLVTTDFDVIEDMLVKDWKVEYSFGIRYKHLLVNRKDQEEDGENVDRILQVSSSDQEGKSVSNGEAPGQDDSSASDTGSDDDAAQQHGGGASDGYQKMGGYQQTHPSSPCGKRHKTSGKEVVKKESPVCPAPPPPGMHGNYYGRPPTDPWGRQLMMPPQSGGYSGYGDYGRGHEGYNAYVPYDQFQFRNHGRQPTHQPGSQPHQRGMYAPRQPPMMTSSPSTPGPQHHGGDLPKIKRESPAVEEERANDFGSLEFISHWGAVTNDAVIAGEEEDIDAEVAAAEAELKLARLRAKRARMARK